MAINNPHLIDWKDEADGYREPSKWSYRNGLKHGEILKQQANHVKWLCLWLVGEWHIVSKIGSTQSDRWAVDGLSLSFENELLAARQRQVANLTLDHE